jgi:hypothetical protein
MPTKLLKNVSGQPTETATVATSAGAGSAGKIPELNASGFIDNTMLPTSAKMNFADSEAVTFASGSATLAHAPSPSLSLILVVNGVTWQQTVDYTISGATLTAVQTVPTGANVYAWYRY